MNGNKADYINAVNSYYDGSIYLMYTFVTNKNIYIMILIFLRTCFKKMAGLSS